MSTARTAIVTGANKGIGLAIVRQLALQYADSALGKQGPLLIYQTARDKSRGEEAVQSIESDPLVAKAKALASQGGPVTVTYHALDIADSKSIRAFSEYLQQQHPDGVDIVINNAGIALRGFDIDLVKTTLHCNYYGTLEATDALLPLIRPGGRLVNVASTGGKLEKYSAPLREQFLATRSRDDVTVLMQAFDSAVAAGTHEADGWPSAAYGVSKAGVIGVTRAIALEHQAAGGKVLVNSCCPGWVKTDMTRGNGVKTPDEGAQTPVLLALGDIGGKVGLFWRNEQPIEW